MATINKWVIHTATGEFICGGFYDPTVPDVDHSIVTLTGAYAENMPEPSGQKWNGSAVVDKTQAEINAYDAAKNTAAFTATSQQKDILATCALIVRAKGVAAWNAMTLQQKKDATLAEAAVWVNIRQFIEDNI